MITEEDAERVCDWLRDTSERGATARYNRELTEGYIKIVKARIMVSQNGLSNAAAETIAFASPEYEAAIRAYAEAVEADEKFRFLREAAIARLDFWRSIEATRRIEGKIL